MEQIASFSKIEKSAYVEIKKHIEISRGTKVPVCFKMGVIQSVDHAAKVITINITARLPIGNCGDGVSANEKAVHVLRFLYGVFTLSK